MGVFMAMPMGTGPRRDDLEEAAKNWRNCCPPIPKPRMLPAKQRMMGKDTHMGMVGKNGLYILGCCVFPDAVVVQTVPCICCIRRAPCSMGLGVRSVVWVAWHRLTILGGGAVWGGTGMALGNKHTRENGTWSIISKQITQCYSWMIHL